MYDIEEKMRSYYYWQVQIEETFYAAMDRYRMEHELDEEGMAEVLGVSLPVMSSMRNRRSNLSLQVIIGYCMKLDLAPVVTIRPIPELIKEAKKKR